MESASNTSAGFDIGAVIVGGGYALISVFGTIGNVLVIYAVITTEKLQNSSSVFLTNLAVTDLITCVVFSLLVVSRLATYQESLCLITLSIRHTTILVSVLSLASIALNRLILILSPMKYYLNIFRRRGFTIWITALWINAFAVAALLPDLFGIGRLGYDQKFKVCRPDNQHEKSDLYDAILILVVYPGPLLTIIVSYFVIFVKVMRHNRRLRTQVISLSLPASQSSTSVDNGEKRRNRHFKLRVQITKNMFYIFCAFVLCITPHAICNFTECPLEAYSRLIISTNSMLNPLIYGFNHPQFREAFRWMIKREELR